MKAPTTVRAVPASCAKKVKTSDVTKNLTIHVLRTNKQSSASR